MKLLFYGVLTFLLVFCFSCSSDTKSSKNIFTQGSYALDTVIGYCYQIHNKILEESVEVQVSQDKLTGRGGRLYLKSQKFYELKIDGVLKGEEMEVTIYASNPRKKDEAPIVHREYWVLTEKQLFVKERATEQQEGDFSYVRTRCQLYPNKDSTLYDVFGSYSEGFAVVGRDGLYGLINEKGVLVLPLQYRYLGNVSEGTIVFFDQNSALYGLLDVNGKVLVEAKYGALTAFGEGLAAFLDEEGLWGFLDTNLDVVIPAQYKGIYYYSGDPTRIPFHEGLANVQLEDNLWGFINKKGELVIDGKFIYVEPFEQGKARVFKNNKWYYINKSGECVENCE